MDALYQEAWDLLSRLAPGENRLRQAFAFAYERQRQNDMEPMQALLKMLRGLEGKGKHTIAHCTQCMTWDGCSFHCECGEVCLKWEWAKISLLGVQDFYHWIIVKGA